MSRKDWRLIPMGSFDIGQGVCQLQTWWSRSSRDDADGWTDLASAYVLRPLNRLVLDFKACGRGQINERKSGSIPDRSLSEGT